MVLTEYDEQAHIRNEREIALEEGRAEGEARLAGLMQCLLEAGRMDDVKRVTVEAELREELYKEFGLKE